VNTASWWDPLDGLTDEQRTCLLHGFNVLYPLRSELLVVPKVDAGCSCWASDTLNSEWAKAAQKYEWCLGPREFLSEIRKVSSSWDVCSPTCIVFTIQVAIDTFLNSFDTKLVEIFSC
jgi:hypothetical protein